MFQKMKVLVTGASGIIGQAFREECRQYYSLKLMYHKTPFKAISDEEILRADIRDFNSVLESMKDVEAVVHLAASSNALASWSSVCSNNIVGTYNVFEASRQMQIKKIVFASSNHACGFSILESEIVGPEAPVRPDGFYGVSKVFGETLGRYYSDKYGMSVICLRIGIFRKESPRDFFKKIRSGKETHSFYPKEKVIGLWIGKSDMAQLIHKSLQTNLKFGIFYASSNNTPNVFDSSKTRELLAFKPNERAEDHY